MVKTTVEPFKDVLKRQKPDIIGEPYVMQAFSNNLPRSAGDPWRGAYSKHGFWYKFHEGDKKDFDKLVALSSEQNANELMLNYDYVTVWQNAYGRDNVRVLMAKNLKGDVMGGLVAINKKDHTQIGTYYVVEEYRHSGIGSKMFQEVLRNKPGVFQAVHILLPTISRFGLKECYGRRFNHVKIENPSGFPDLQETIDNCRVVLSDVFSPAEWDALCLLDLEVCGETRPIRELLHMEDSHVAAVFSDTNACLGFGISKELAGDTVRRLVIGPLYAVEEKVAEVITRAVLKTFYNPDMDFDFDPDPHAIYRRSVEFLLPAEERLLPVIEKLNGEDGKLTRPRLWYQTCSTKFLPGTRMDMVYAVGDLHGAVI